MHGEWIYLSYPLSSSVPVYGGGQGFTEHAVQDTDKGDSCNTSCWTIPNHTGTHLDFPRHFVPRGKTLDDFEPGFFVFENALVAELSQVEPAQIIGPKDLDLDGASEATEILLIKSGFGNLRSQEVYWRENPGFTPELADWLRRELPNLRVIGFDSISLSSFAHRELGREAHRTFLDHEHSIMPLEDMDLSQIGKSSKVQQLIVAPLLVSGANGSPCTVMCLVER